MVAHLSSSSNPPSSFNQCHGRCFSCYLATWSAMPGYVKAPTDTEQRPSRSPTMLSSLIRWLQIKKYQYEVTFSLYMLTSTEKVVFSRRLPMHGELRLMLMQTPSSSFWYHSSRPQPFTTCRTILPSSQTDCGITSMENLYTRRWSIPMALSIAKETVTMSLKNALSSDTTASALRNMHEL